MGLSDRITGMGLDAASNIANILNDWLKEMLRINKEKTKHALMEMAKAIADRNYPFTGQFASCRILAGRIKNEELKNKIIELIDKETEMRSMGQEVSGAWRTKINGLINSAEMSRKEKNALINAFDKLHKINDALRVPEMGQVEHFRSKIKTIVEDEQEAQALLDCVDAVAKKGVSMTKGLNEIYNVIKKSKLSETEKKDLFKFMAEARSSLTKLSTRVIPADVYNNLKWALNDKMSDKVKAMAITDGRYMLAYPAMFDNMVLDLIKAHTMSINTVADLKRTSKEVMVFDNVSPAVAFKALQINRTDGKEVKQPMAIEKKPNGKYKVFFKMDAEDRAGTNKRYTAVNKLMASAVFMVVSGEQDNAKNAAEFKLRETNAILDAVTNVHNKTGEMPYITGKFTEDKGKTYVPKDGGVIVTIKKDFRQGTFTPSTMLFFDSQKAMLKHEDRSSVTLRAAAGLDKYKNELLDMAQKMAGDSIFIPKAQYDKLNEKSKELINRVIVDSKNAKMPLTEYIRDRLNELETAIAETNKNDKNYGVYVNEKSDILAVKAAVQKNDEGKTVVDKSQILNKLITNEYIKNHHYNEKMTRSDALETTMVAKVSKEYRDNKDDPVSMQVNKNNAYVQNKGVESYENCKDSTLKDMLNALYHEQDKRLNQEYTVMYREFTEKVAKKDPQLANQLRDEMGNMDYMDLTPKRVAKFKDAIKLTPSLGNPDKLELVGILSEMEDRFGYDMVSRKDVALDELKDMTERCDEIQMNLTDNILNLSEYTRALTKEQEKSMENIERELGKQKTGHSNSSGKVYEKEHREKSKPSRDEDIIVV